jgi:phage baseplate assembly protein W
VSDNTGQPCSDALVAKESIRVAVASILRTRPRSDPSQPCFGERVLNVCGRSLTGLNSANVAKAAKIAIDTFEPLIHVRDIAVEMTPASAVNAIVVHYEVIESGALHDIRIEIPT